MNKQPTEALRIPPLANLIIVETNVLTLLDNDTLHTYERELAYQNQSPSLLFSVIREYSGGADVWEESVMKTTLLHATTIRSIIDKHKETIWVPYNEDLSYDYLFAKAVVLDLPELLTLFQSVCKTCEISFPLSLTLGRNKIEDFYGKDENSIEKMHRLVEALYGIFEKMGESREEVREEDLENSRLLGWREEFLKSYEEYQKAKKEEKPLERWFGQLIAISGRVEQEFPQWIQL